jgi:hypothetical protein
MFNAMSDSLADSMPVPRRETTPAYECALLAGALGYDSRVKRFVVYAAVLVVLAVSLAAGWIAADWPSWCKRLQWCASNFPQ